LLGGGVVSASPTLGKAEKGNQKSTPENQKKRDSAQSDLVPGEKEKKTLARLNQTGAPSQSTQFGERLENREWGKILAATAVREHPERDQANSL